jgi:hypothetical protein
MILVEAQRSSIVTEISRVKARLMRVQVKMRTLLEIAQMPFLLHSGKGFIYILSVS